MKEYLKSLIGVMFGAIALTLPAAISAQPISPGGGGSNWEITTERVGANKYTFPIPDSAAQGGYRMTTNSKDWATGKWTIDGVLQSGNPGIAAFDSATWNTPTPYTGFAEAKGQYTFRVKWIGTGTPPTYMYLAMNSTVCSFDDPGLAGVSLTGSNGQSDPFLVTYGVGLAAGTHAKRLKLNSTGEATYTVNLNTKAQKSSTYADLKASAAATVSLTAKALGLFRETNKRSPEGSAEGPVFSVRASTGDVEHERAELGMTKIDYSGPIFMAVYPDDGWDPTSWTTGSLGSLIDVQRIGSWLSATETFSSSISTGSRGEIYPPVITSISVTQDYSGAQIAQMRESALNFSVNAHQGDSESIIPGPFDSAIDVKVWAPERIISKSPYDTSPVIRYLTLAGGSEHQDVTPLEDTTVIVGTTTTNELNAEFSVATGSAAGIPLPVIGIGVKADCGFKLGFKHSIASYGGSSTHLNHPSIKTRVRFKLEISQHMLHRNLAKYGPSGYEGDFSNDIANSAHPTIGSAWEFTFPFGF